MHNAARTEGAVDEIHEERKRTACAHGRRKRGKVADVEVTTYVVPCHAMSCHEASGLEPGWESEYLPT